MPIHKHGCLGFGGLGFRVAMEALEVTEVERFDLASEGLSVNPLGPKTQSPKPRTTHPEALKPTNPNP